MSNSLLLLLLLSRFSCARLCATPETEAYQAPPSLGFSRQEHRSGWPFPSPMNESKKWKWSRSVVSDSAIPWTEAYQAPPSMGSSRQEYGAGCHCLLRFMTIGNTKMRGQAEDKPFLLSRFIFTLWILPTDLRLRTLALASIILLTYRSWVN